MRRKLKTAIIDIDPQQSAWKWNQSRPKEIRLDITACDAAALPDKVEKARTGGIDLLIIDTPPQSNSEARLPRSVPTSVLIPCCPNRFDLDAIPSTVDIAKAANTPAAVRALSVIPANMNHRKASASRGCFSIYAPVRGTGIG